MQRKIEDVCLIFKKLNRANAIKEMVNYVEGEEVFIRALIAENKESTPSILSEKMGVTKGRITAIINRLRAKGYITIKQSEADRRRVEITLTPAGEQHAIDEAKAIEAYVESYFASVGKGKAQKLLDLIEDVTEKLN